MLSHSFVDPARCLDPAEIMLARSMSIIHYCKGAVVENVKMIAKIQELERKNQELLKDKVKEELTLSAKSLELTQGQGRINTLKVEAELLKKIRRG
ncbi:hypothetical protein ACSQ67_016660 [Phaseolus vulgaris]